ncbi:MAG: hypothetical protein ACLQU2_22240, partial [Candidatus Binataceae bacterium]
DKSGEIVPSNYALVDIDLDCDETRALASYFLPQTDLLFGRGKMPVTHMVYRINSSLTIDKFEDPVRTAERKELKDRGDKDKIKSMLVEIRGSGFQTMVPPSKHPETGEILQWVRQGKPGDVTITDLRSRVARLAAASLLVRYYPAEGSQWNASIALAGVLLRNGWSVEEVVDFSTWITLAATGKDERKKRERDIRNAAERLANDNGPVKGWPSLIEYFTERVAQQIGKWLALPRGAANKADNRFYLDEGRTFSRTYNKKGEVSEVQLANFSAVHTATIIRTDGADSTENLALTVKLQHGQQRTVTIPSDKFAAMDWVVPALSANNAYLCSGPGVKDAMRHAIQAQSGDVVIRTIYTHTGWRKVGDTWVFLYQGGALGVNGLVPDISVELPLILQNFNLPLPPTGKQLAAAAQAWRRLIKLGPARIMAPLVCLPWSAIVATADLTVHLAGKSGGFKTEVATLIQRCFGSGFNSRTCISWESTAGALEVILFTAKDVVLLIDDYAPTGSISGDYRRNVDVNRLVRAQGNRSARSRLNRDATLKDTKAPRGLALSTGENYITGESASGRALNIDVVKGDITKEALTAAQLDAPLFAGLTAAFIQYVAKDLEQVRNRVVKRAAELRKNIDEGLHGRTVTTIAMLLASLDEFLNFTLATNAFTQQTADEIRKQIDNGLNSDEGVSRVQQARQAAEDPCKRFFELLRSALRSCQVHISTVGGSPPDNSDLWGWSTESTHSGPQLARIGWVDSDDLYLEPNASLKAANDASNGKPIGLSTVMLGRRLPDDGYLQSTEEKREVNTIRKVVVPIKEVSEEAKQLRIATWHVKTSILLGEAIAPIATKPSKVASKVRDINTARTKS